MIKEQLMHWKDRLAAALAATGKTQREISLTAGLGPGYLHSIFSEGKEPTLQNIIKICDAAGISFVGVIGGVDMMDPFTEELCRRSAALDEVTRQSLLHILNGLAPPNERTSVKPTLEQRRRAKLNVL